MAEYILEVRRGSENKRAKINEDLAREIYRRSWSGDETMQVIADDYDITTSVVSRIKHRDAWFAATSDLYKQRINGGL